MYRFSDSRIQDIVSNSNLSYRQEFRESVAVEYNLSVFGGMNPYFFSTITYDDKYFYNDDRTIAIDYSAHQEHIAKFGRIVSRKFGGHLEYFGAFDIFDYSIGTFPHSHGIWLSDKPRTHKNMVELSKLLKGYWQNQNDKGNWVKRGKVELSPFDEARTQHCLNYIYDGHDHPIRQAYWCASKECPRRRCEHWQKSRELRQTT